MTKKQSTKQFYNEIREAFEKTNVKEFGVNKFTPDWIFAKLGKRFHRKPKTIEKIIFHRI